MVMFVQLPGLTPSPDEHTDSSKLDLMRTHDNFSNPARFIAHHAVAAGYSAWNLCATVVSTSMEDRCQRPTSAFDRLHKARRDMGGLVWLGLGRDYVGVRLVPPRHKNSAFRRKRHCRSYVFWLELSRSLRPRSEEIRLAYVGVIRCEHQPQPGVSSVATATY